MKNITPPRCDIVILVFGLHLLCSDIIWLMAWKSAWRDRRNYSYHSTHTPSNHRRKSNRLLYRLGLFSFIGVIGLLLLTFIAFPLLAFNLPSPDKLVRRDGFSTKIYDRNKTLLYDIYTNERRTPVKLEDIPPYLKQATIAIEDKNFYKHQGYWAQKNSFSWGYAWVLGYCENSGRKEISEWILGEFFTIWGAINRSVFQPIYETFESRSKCQFSF